MRQDTAGAVAEPADALAVQVGSVSFDEPGGLMQYYVVHDRSGVLRAVVRTTPAEEAFTRDLEWVESTLLSRARREQGWTVAEVDSEHGGEQLFLLAREVRQERQRAERAGGYEYFAVLRSEWDAVALGQVDALVRRRDGRQELLGPDGAWQASEERLADLLCLPISEAEHDRLRWVVAQPRWYVLTDPSEPDGSHPVAVVRKIPAVEEGYTRDLRWEPSDLLGQPGLRVEEVGYEMDADQHRFAIETGVRKARQRTEWAGGYEYFAITHGPRPRFDLDEVLSVVRRSAGVEEAYVREGLWVRSAKVRDIERAERYSFDRCLPISPEEAARVTAGFAWPRCFLVLDGARVPVQRVAESEWPDFPVAVVRVVGETEEAFTRELVWGPSDLLRRVADEPRWTVEESLSYTDVQHAYHLARHLRGTRQRTEWPGPYQYFAISRSMREAVDVDAAHGIVRTDRTGLREERYAGRGVWERSYELEDIGRGKSDDEYMPISPDEAERLVARLDG